MYAVAKTFELHFEQPMDQGYNQIWILPREVKKGEPAKVEGFGMTAVFVQLAEGLEKTRNVSSDCSASGTVTFDEVPKVGGKASGKVDVTIECSGVAELTGPIAIKGAFAELPVKK